MDGWMEGDNIPTLFLHESVKAGTPEGCEESSFQVLDGRKELLQAQRKHAESIGSEPELNPEPSLCPPAVLIAERPAPSC